MVRRAGDPAFRPLRVFAFDPSRGRNLANHMAFRVPYERLGVGPVGEYVAVVDYDASNDVHYLPVDLDSPEVLLRGGLDPSESDPRFHQQMVYAVVSETIRRFEFALGRKVHWRRLPGRSARPRRLRIFPHAFQEANAYYDAELGALLFGYFPAQGADVGANLPGQTVFTCLSHDIVVHEATHALIDGLRDQFTEPTGVDVAAFHEAFADVIALFQHFSYQEALVDTLQRGAGSLRRARPAPGAGPDAPANPLVDLARQFGEATGMRAALRSALDAPGGPQALAKLTEPHQRGSILVGAVFDAFFAAYDRRARPLLRMSSTRGAAGGELHPDLADQLAGVASSLAAQFVTVCVRALDYCPPVDIRFGEFLRALVTSDFDLARDDGAELRTALIEAFRARGIVPEGVASYSEEALRWRPTDAPVGPCVGLDFDLLGERPERAARHNAGLLRDFARRHARRLGLSPRHPVEVHSHRAIHRVSPRGIFVFDFVVEFLQQEEVPLASRAPRGPSFTFRGGTTVLFDQQGEVRYSIRKRIDNARRLDEERDFRDRAVRLAPAAAGRSLRAGIDFAAAHRGF